MWSSVVLVVVQGGITFMEEIEDVSLIAEETVVEAGVVMVVVV